MKVKKKRYIVGIDIKSLIIGFLLACCVALIMGASEEDDIMSRLRQRNNRARNANQNNQTGQEEAAQELAGAIRPFMDITNLNYQKSNPGRFQCASTHYDSFGVFVLDTQTGHVWRLSDSDSYDYGFPWDRGAFKIRLR